MGISFSMVPVNRPGTRSFNWLSALDWTFDDAQRLLQAAQKSSLYPRIKRDAAVLYCLNHRLSIIETQDMLHELGLGLLGGE